MAELMVAKPDDVQKEIEATQQRIKGLKGLRRVAANLDALTQDGRGATLKDIPNDDALMNELKNEQTRLRNLRKVLAAATDFHGAKNEGAQ